MVDAPNAGVVIALITYTLHVQLKPGYISLESKLWVRALVPACGAAWSDKTGFGGSGRTLLAVSQNIKIE